jgi:hypothetical protein
MTDDDRDIANFTTSIEPTPQKKKPDVLDNLSDEHKAGTVRLSPPKRPRLYRKRRKLPAARSMEARHGTSDDYAGVTGTDCPINCNPKRCVITHTGHCGHPRKGALFSEEQMNPAILKRWNAVRKILAMATTAKRFKDEDE